MLLMQNFEDRIFAHTKHANIAYISMSKDNQYNIYLKDKQPQFLSFAREFKLNPNSDYSTK